MGRCNLGGCTLHNQDDNQEKAVQVQRMGNVYETASHVLVWLGTSDAIADLSEYANKPRSRFQRLTYYMLMNNTPEELEPAMTEFARHPYWERAWIQQEIMLARSLTLVCGMSETTTKALRGKCVNNEPEWIARDLLLDELSIPKVLFGFVFGGITVLFDVLGIEQATEATPILRLLTEAGRNTREVNFWEYLSLRGGLSKCFDPRDHIYSMLALTGHDTTFSVSYTENIVNTFWRSAEYFKAWSSPKRLYAL